MGEVVKPQQGNAFTLGEAVEYQDAERTSELARMAVHETGIVRVVNFPVATQALAEFAGTFGPLMPKYQASGTSAEDYVGVVRTRPDIRPEDRLATERDGELRPHTAKSWGLRRPRYFGLLMVDPGWTDQPSGMNGESRFVRADDAVGELERRFPQTADEDFHLLVTTPVRFTATHIKDEVADMPIVFPVDDGDRLGLRYKENMRDVLTKLVPPTEEGKRYVQAVERFDESLQTAPHIEVPLGAGELILLDNRSVAHARHTFLADRTDAQGRTVTNPRCLYNVHVHEA